MRLNRKNSHISPRLAIALGAAAGLAVCLLVAGKNGARLRNKVNEIRKQGLETILVT